MPDDTPDIIHVDSFSHCVKITECSLNPFECGVDPAVNQYDLMIYPVISLLSDFDFYIFNTYTVTKIYYLIVLLSQPMPRSLWGEK